jgi:hypothetical protein
MRMFGRPKGRLGWLGGVLIARVNRDAAAQIIELLNVRPDDKVLEVGFGPGVAIQLLLQGGSVAGNDLRKPALHLSALGFTVNSGQPKQGVAESLAAVGFAQAQIVDTSKLICAIATKL